MAENNAHHLQQQQPQQQQPPNIQEQVLQILSNQQLLMTQILQQQSATQLAIRNLSYDERFRATWRSSCMTKTMDTRSTHGFPETVDRLKSLFGATVSIFRRRFNCLQLTKEESDDYLTYSCKVNKACVDSKLSELTEEQFKCLIYVCGLKSNQDTEVRMHLINKLNENVNLTLQQVVDKCNSLINLKQDTVLVENPSSVVNAVVYDKRSKSKHQSAASSSSNQREQPKTPCWSCGGMHYNKDCRFRDQKCNECGKVGHRAGYCACFQSRSSSNANTASRKKKKQPSTKTVTIRNIIQGRKFVKLQVNNVLLRLQLDTGSDISIISHRSWIKLGRPHTKPTVCTARTASGEPLDLVAEMWCNISLNGVTKGGKCFVAAPNVSLDILGIDWMDLFGLWNQPITSFCNQVSAQPSQTLATLHTQFPEVFTNEMGLCKKAPVKLVLKGDPKPVFKPKRPVAYCIEGVVEDEICRLENLGILKKVDFAEWAAPIVVVRKPNGTVRICADFSTGLNSVLEPNQYPLPLPEDIFAKMSGCRVFSHIDLSDAYLQVEVDPESQPLLTINTHKGLFQFTRLSPGIKSAPGAFQQMMDTMLAGLPCTVGYLDDIVVGGRTEEEHRRNLFLVLQRLQAFGFTVRIEKCSFHMRQVKYLGQILDGDGIRPDPDKIAPVVNMPAPHDVTALRAYLGAVNYYGKYVPEMRSLRHPMDQLLKAGEKFEWSPACQKSFDRFREILQSPLLLTHYNPKLELVVSADASSVVLGARIAHKFPDGTVKAICHASRSLTAAESNYSQIEKEGLALIFAVTKFHRMIFGRRFVLETDHKPLLAIFGSKKGIPTYTANRLQRWALTLLLYDFDIHFVSTDAFGHADILSRLINRHVRPEEDYVIANIEFESTIRSIMNQSLEALPVSFKTVQAKTRIDETLQQVIKHVNTTWPTKKTSITDPHIQEFFQRRESLSITAGCLMYGERLVLPSVLRKKVLVELHKGHPGIERMRSLARQYVYWPHIDKDIERLVQTCNECSSVAKTDRKTNLESWPVPEKPWQRLHLDYAGPMDGWYFLILVDAYTKWPEVVRTKDITSAATIRILHDISARFGSPETLVTDNGTQFTSEMFEAYCEFNAILHLKTAPFHPQSNGLAEKFVDTFKRTLKKITAGGETLQDAINTFLQCYRSTPCRTAPEGKSPAELLADEFARHQQFDRRHGAKPRNYIRQDLVWAKVFRNNKWHWEAGEVLERIGQVMYNVWLPGKQIMIRSHCNQLRTRHHSENKLPATEPAKAPLSILLDSWNLQSPTPVQEERPSLLEMDEFPPQASVQRQRNPPR
ncbi:uncharacterized protein K02A2.6-like [Toxorhynchites rutilus septentrionalis]|uniref:uncharacterized protein K02A2.6-like n=1 Tax=Toxorhynchites rutilus septentrionalis TaxID=329112 RepID=UPI00247AFA2C|nr:uncharacterized protein K02A2.6-like [Toxorhynchites rutilus septentrionalis]